MGVAINAPVERQSLRIPEIYARVRGCPCGGGGCGGGGTLKLTTLVTTNLQILSTRQSYYAPNFLPAKPFTRQTFYPPNFLRAKLFTRQTLYAPNLLPAKLFTHQTFYPPNLLRTKLIPSKTYSVQTYYVLVDFRNFTKSLHDL